MEEEQRAGLKPLVRLLGNKIVALRNQCPLIFDAEDSGIKRVFGNARIDCLAGYFEERKGLPFGVEIAAVDRCERAALLGERFSTGALKLELAAAQYPGNNQPGIETKKLQVDGMAGFKTFQDHFAKFNAFLNNLPTSGIGYGEGGIIFQFRGWSLR